MINAYPIFSIEDWLDEDDFEGWKEMNSRVVGLKAKIEEKEKEIFGFTLRWI